MSVEAGLAPEGSMMDEGPAMGRELRFEMLLLGEIFVREKMKKFQTHSDERCRD